MCWLTACLMLRTSMAIYPDSMSLRDARERYFELSGIDGGGYTAKWVTLARIGPIPLGFPNTPNRVRSVKLHDLHHVLTEYDADFTGEAEIAAWEIGAGCHRHHAAWLLNLAALTYGLALAPKRVLRAFARGRRSETLYAARELDEALLDETVGELRVRLHLDGASEAPVALDRLSLALWWSVGVSITLGPILVALWLALRLSGAA